MGTRITAAITAILLSGYVFSQNIPVTWEQTGNDIQITYDLKGDQSKTYTVEVFCSTDAGQTFGSVLKSVTGDVGAGIRPGYNKKITWNVLSDRDGLEGDIAFRLTAIEEVSSKKTDASALGIPATFTPGTNSLFKPDPDKWQGTGRHKIIVTNSRYEKVWESQSFQNGWDGKVKGKNATPGPYSWVLDIYVNDRDIQTVKGEVIVVAASIGSATVTPAAAKTVQGGPDELYDERDGKTYKTVRIGTQTWMAENLNYGMVQGRCYEEKDENCEVFGKLFEWETAKMACPNGWHLPSEEEWKILLEYVGGNKVAGGKLKESGYAHWASPNTDATDMFGFRALPAGFRFSNGTYRHLGKVASFWTSSKCSGNGACIILLREVSGKSEKIAINRLDGRSVRCLKNN